MLTTEQSWHPGARCRDADPELFFAKAAERAAIASAKRICAGCPVREQCLSQALEDESLEGIWGGTTERERTAARLRLRLTTFRRSA
ncbi:WhiB family transcriptional regulator [Actinomadura macrotermitis]|uniref:Transcriptional regulator WhiB n=1 Tax=Actinomadura macrotermitis TaxID=2585200 RepID=A0A7K0C2U3_9ACTN|nr:WhiB family transcriptional regulator [Actinomadura macrotermitis]MQY07755.1 Transcriptional regulator WhiB1 [Actinomadura macrotermitis]